MSALSMIVDRMHVGASDDEVVEYVMSRMTEEFRTSTKATDVKRRADVAREAIKIHRRNQRFYDSIYGAGMADVEKEITERLYGGADIREAIEAAEEGGE